MNFDETFFSTLLQAAGLGLGVAILLGLLRRVKFIRRISISILGVVTAVGLEMVLRAAGIPQEDMILKVITSLAILLAANAFLQAIDLVMWSFLVGRLKRVAVPRLLVDLFNLTVLIGVVLVILDRIFAVNLTAVLITSTVVSAVIGLSLQDTLGNVMSGLALQLDRPFDVGDWVHMGGIDGEIMQMNWRSITLRSLDNHWSVIPNANVARLEIINYSRPTLLQRQHLEIGMSYSHPPGEVKQVLQQAVCRADGVIAEPPPTVLVKGFDSSAVLYDVRYWIDNFARYADIRDHVLSQIWYVTQREGLVIPFPIQDINVRQLPEDYEQKAQERLQQEIFSQLRPLTVFAPFSDEQIIELAQHAQVHQYTLNELLVEQGDEGDSLFVIKSGQARVDVRDERGQVTTVAYLGPKEFFGEMSLLTGQQRSASVIAEGETEVILVDKSVLARVLAADPEALEALSQVVEERFQNSADKVAAAAQAKLGASDGREHTLLARIQSFLGLK